MSIVSKNSKNITTISNESFALKKAKVGRYVEGTEVLLLCLK